MRLDKVLEQEGMGSKKKVKRLFQMKQVLVDGVIAIDGSQNVDPELHTIVVNKQKICQSNHVYYMLNKPAGVVTAVKDLDNQTVIDLIDKKDQRQKLFPVGRLDRDTEGLLLITDNGQLGYQLLQPHKKVTKQYEVIVNERLTEVDCECFSEGIVFHGGIRCQPAELTILSSTEGESRAILAIKEGKFHQVKKMFLSVGKKVVYLKRISMGPLVLDPHLARGAYRSLNEVELEALRPYFVAHKKKN